MNGPKKLKQHNENKNIAAATTDRCNQWWS